jgi:hypothetical protein
VLPYVALKVVEVEPAFSQVEAPNALVCHTTDVYGVALAVSV